MSIPGIGITAVEGAGLALLQTIMIKPKRALGNIVAQVTVEELARDQLIITDHPVEQGAVISDHAYKLPAEVIIRCGWSNSPSPASTDLLALPGNIITGLAGTFTGFAVSPTYVATIYAQLLALQASIVPFDVVTGKRTYHNMLFAELSQTTDVHSENALIIVARCKQLTIAQAQVVTVPPAANQAQPQITAPPTNMGTVQPAPAPQFNGIKLSVTGPGLP